MPHPPPSIIAKYYFRMVTENWHSITPPTSIPLYELLDLDIWFNNEHGTLVKLAVGTGAVVICFVIQVRASVQQRGLV